MCVYVCVYTTVSVSSLVQEQPARPLRHDGGLGRFVVGVDGDDGDDDLQHVHEEAEHVVFGYEGHCFAGW